MNDTMGKLRPRPAGLGGLVLLLLSVSVALAAGNIDLIDKWAWGTNAGWINFELGADGGVTVYSDHLEGYAWGENIGWIRLGTCTSGSPCSHANDTADTYGVNNDGVGNLSGYAWGTNIGWINFAPANGGVWVDPVTGDFSGYAWGENVGWIKFQGDSPAYKVTTGWRGALTSTYTHTVAAIITGRRPNPASSAGLTTADDTFLQEAGDGILFGHNDAAFANVATDLPDGVDKRWARLWQLDVNDQGSNGGNVTLTFDISEAGGQGQFSATGEYFLLKRATGSGDAFATVTVVGSPSVDGDQLTFTVDANQLGSEFTLGATAASPTAVQMQGLTARSGGFNLTSGLARGGLWGLGVLSVLAVGLVWTRRRKRA